MRRKKVVYFLYTTKVSLDCTKCKVDLEQVSEGNVIKFYFLSIILMVKR